MIVIDRRRVWPKHPPARRRMLRIREINVVPFEAVEIRTVVEGPRGIPNFRNFWKRRGSKESPLLSKYSRRIRRMEEIYRSTRVARRPADSKKKQE